MEQKTTIVKKGKYRLLFPVFILIIAVFTVVYFFYNTNEIDNMSTKDTLNKPTYSSALLGGDSIVFDIFVADEPDERSLGLSVFDNLSENQVMLFVFDEMGNYPFWMKDMKFPIDIVWLDDNGIIVFIKENAQPSDYENDIHYNPNVDALYVMEFVHGFVGSHGLGTGQKLNIENFYK